MVGGTPPAVAAKSVTSTIPIVFTDVGDPVGIGLVASLARPGGNLTGFSNLNTELAAKRVELLSEIVPRASVIALLVNPTSATAESVIRYTQEATRAKIGAVVAMRVEDYYPGGKRWWVRLHEKRGKRHEMPAHHKLEQFLDKYLATAGIREDGKTR